MNTYKKYCPNVFVAKCPDPHQRGETIILTTKRGKKNEHIVHNLVGRLKDGSYCYSITRADGFNVQERAKRKAERLQGYAENAKKRSDAAYQASREGEDFLKLAEPIKIGHHSEKRHRALIERNWNRMGKSVRESEKAEDYLARAEYWESKTEEINLSMPESIEYFEYKLAEAQINHEGMKDGTIERAHSYSLTYAKKAVNEMTKKFELAKRLWQD